MRNALPAVLFAAAVLAAACSTTVAGTPTKSTGATSQPGVDLARLDVGPYPTTPSQPLGVAGDPARGVILEAQRMSNHVIGPWETDPAVTAWFGFGALVLQDAQAVSMVGPSEFAAVAAQRDFINGFASARTQENEKMLMNAVLRFADDAAATSAAADMGEAAMGQKGADGPAQTASIPGHPESRATSYTTVDRQGQRWNAVRAFTSHGPYVFMQLAQSTEGAPQATELVAKTVELQGPEIDRFRPTDVAEFADISIDPTGLLARTIPVDEQDATVTQNTTYERRGALHLQSDPARSAKLFSDTGTDLVAVAKTNVYETADADGAVGVVDGFFAELQPTSQPAKEVQNLPGSRCLRLEDGAFYCLATADRYAIETSSSTLLDAQQLAAAQYAMLMNS
jgi:hypothetical protein